MREWIVFILGGIAYGSMEILFRGHTHWTMILTGGACVLTFYYLSEWILSMPLITAGLVGGLIITLYELSVGYIVNICLGWDVWDYSRERYNLMGQICLKFSVTWFLVSLSWFSLIKLVKNLWN